MGKEFKNIEENIKEKFHDASKSVSDAIDKQEELLKRDLTLEYGQEVPEKNEEKAPIIPESDLKKDNVDIKVDKKDGKISNLKKLELELEMIAYKVGETGIN